MQKNAKPNGKLHQLTQRRTVNAIPPRRTGTRKGITESEKWKIRIEK